MSGSIHCTAALIRLTNSTSPLPRDIIESHRSELSVRRVVIHLEYDKRAAQARCTMIDDPHYHFAVGGTTVPLLPAVPLYLGVSMYAFETSSDNSEPYDRYNDPRWWKSLPDSVWPCTLLNVFQSFWVAVGNPHRYPNRFSTEHISTYFDNHNSAL